MTEPSINSVLGFLNRCFKEDNQSVFLLDFLNSKRVEHLHIFDGPEELLNGAYPKQAIGEDYGKKVLKATQLYAKEKTLFYASVFLVGKVKIIGEFRSIAAPVILSPAHITEKEGELFVNIDQGQCQLNNSILGLLGFQEREKTLLFQKEFPSFPIDFAEVGNLIRLFNNCENEFDTTQLFDYPALWNRRKLNAFLKNKDFKENEFKLVPMSALGLVSNSDETYGINWELEELLKLNSYPSSMQAIYGNADVQLEKVNKPIWTPTVLSSQQQKALVNARDQLLSLVIGPPGTGKSYTIAAIAVDHILRGKSVLIVSRQDEAVNVVAEKITELLGHDHMVVRAGAKRNLSSFKKRLRNLLRRTTLLRKAKSEDVEERLENTNKELEKVYRKLGQLLRREMKISALLKTTGVINKIKLYVRLKLLVPSHSPAITMQKLTKITSAKIQLVKELVNFNYSKQVNGILRYHRNVLEKLYQGLRSKLSSEREQIFDSINHMLILKAFPIWLSKLSELYSSIPLDKEMFDLVIIDEASQVDLASPIPALYRAKKVVVCGDPNQLRHYSFISRTLEQQYKEDFKLKGETTSLIKYRDLSILDMLSLKIKSNNQVAFLDEHFRSVPEIISFSNKNFYGSELRIMTERPIGKKSTGVFNHFVSGKRNAKGQNPIEVDFIFSALKEIIEKESELSLEVKSSIGILSPLTDQAKALEKRAITELSGEQILAHKFRVGTPFSFQGEEKDIMFLSMAVDASSHHSALVQLNKPDVFNVSVTRAKLQQHVVHSVKASELPTAHFLRQYLEVSTPKKHADKAPRAINKEDYFLASIKELIDEMGFNYWSSFLIAGVEIDFLIDNGKRLKAIDLVGYTGSYANFISIERCKILSRAQVPVYLLAYSFWQKDKPKVEEEIRAFISPEKGG